MIKDKHGVCKVIKDKNGTPGTMAGPFQTRAEAQEAKEKGCSRASTKPSKGTTAPTTTPRR